MLIFLIPVSPCAASFTKVPPPGLECKFKYDDLVYIKPDCLIANDHFKRDNPIQHWRAGHGYVRIKPSESNEFGGLANGQGVVVESHTSTKLSVPVIVLHLRGSVRESAADNLAVPCECIAYDLDNLKTPPGLAKSRNDALSRYKDYYSVKATELVSKYGKGCESASAEPSAEQASASANASKVKNQSTAALSSFRLSTS